MMYDTKTKAEIEKVYNVFADYIRDSQNLEWFWSEKLGYILLQISVKRRYIAESQVVVDAGELCKFLFDEIATDVLEWTKNEHASYNADPLERAEIERRWKPYADQLPEYRYLCDKLFQQPEQ